MAADIGLIDSDEPVLDYSGPNLVTDGHNEGIVGVLAWEVLLASVETLAKLPLAEGPHCLLRVENRAVRRLIQGLEVVWQRLLGEPCFVRWMVIHDQVRLASPIRVS